MVKRKRKSDARPRVAAIENGIDSIFSAEHLGEVLERKGSLISNNAREQPGYFYLHNEFGCLVCIFDPNTKTSKVYETVKEILYPTRHEIMAMADAVADDPDTVAGEIIQARQEIWLKYHHES